MQTAAVAPTRLPTAVARDRDPGARRGFVAAAADEVGIEDEVVERVVLVGGTESGRWVSTLVVRRRIVRHVRPLSRSDDALDHRPVSKVYGRIGTGHGDSAIQYGTALGWRLPGARRTPRHPA